MNQCNSRNPSLFIDFGSLPQKLGKETFHENITSPPNMEPNYNNFISVIDRLDEEIDGKRDGLLPQNFECGDGTQFVNRVFGGDFTNIWEFPW